MNSPLLQLLVLAGIAVFLILRLKSVLGTRDGYEKPPVPRGGASQDAKRDSRPPCPPHHAAHLSTQSAQALSTLIPPFSSLPAPRPPGLK